MTTSASQDAQAAEQAASERRRKRKERSAKNRAPEPKNIVSGAGQPLDVGVRRELEEQLGHDFSQVRLHTDRDAGALTDLLGADAVAVGKDIFFGEGAYRPGTDEGRRLLAHELLHTVQNPHGLGALRAGRDLGAVSLPQQAIEREAESAAQALVEPSSAERAEGDGAAVDVEEGQGTPGWLRYATVDADRSRAEQIDPSSLVDRLANDVVRSLRGDPEDLSKRTRRRLARLPEEFVDEVLVRLENRLLGSEHDRVLDFIAEIEAQGELGADSAEWAAQDAPAVEADTAGELRADRTAEQETAAELQAEEERPDAAPGPEKDRAVADGAQGSTPQNGGTPRSGSTPQGADAPRGGEEDQREERPGSGTESGGGSRSPEQAGGRQEQGGGQGAQESEAPNQETSGGVSKGGEQQESGAQDSQQSGSEKGGSDKDGSGKSGSGKSGKDDAGKGEKAGEQGVEQPEQQAAEAESEEESAAKNRPGAADVLAAGQQEKQEDKAGAKQPEGSPAAGRDTQLPGRTSRLDAVRNQDFLDDEERADEDPFGSGSDSEVDVGGAEKSAWDTKLAPEDFLPEKDLDVSGVPTADKIGPGSASTAQAPTFPAPPPTKADKVQAERDAEDAEDEQAEAEPEEAEAEGAAEPERSVETEGSPESDERAGLEGADQRPGPGSPSKDPKDGADPKAGPAAAQRVAQEAPGKTEGGGEAKEPAAKEEKGSPAAGDKAGAAPEKGSQQAAGGTAAASETAGKGGEPKKDEQKNDGQQKSESDPASKGQAEQGGGDSAGQADGKQQDDKSPSPARDSHVTGGSNSSTESGTDSGSRSGAAQESGSAQAEKEPKETKTPASKASPKEPAPEPKDPPKSSAQETKARKEEPAAKDEPASASPKAAPAPKTPGGGGGGGGGAKGGGGGKGKSKESPPAPNLSQVSPEAGLSSASKLKPHRALEAMGGVGGSVDRTVGDEHKKLASAPPNVERPAGSPETLEGKPKTDAPAQYNEDAAKKSDAPKDEKAEVKGAKNPEGQIDAEKMEEPGGWDTFMMGLGFVGGKLVNGIASVFGADEPVVDEQKLAAKFAGLPTGDDALKEAKSGQAPGVEMKGAADDKANEQGEAVDSKGQEAVETGRDDAGRSMGEDQVYPDAPKEQLKAKVPGGEAGKGGVRTGKASTGAVPAEAASKVAEHDRKAEFQGAFSKGAQGVSEGRKTKEQGFRASEQKQKRQVKTEVAKSTREQADERAKAKAEVKTERGTWRTDQDAELKKLGTKKSERHKKARTDVEDEEKKTDDKAKTEEKENDGRIQKRGKQGEDEAKNHTKTAANESGNWVSEAFDWIKKKVIEIKNKIVEAIKAARRAIVTKIKEFKERVEGWINAARKAIVEAVTELIKDLIEFAKNLVKAIVELAKRIWKLITDLVAAAIAFVTKLAAALKKAITDLLDRIAKALSSILSVLKKMLMDVVKAVVDAIKTVLEYASKLLGALGEFMMIAVDFMSDPGGWLSGAKNSAVDGAKNHLFREVKSAVKDWFQSKIEEIIGVPKAILDKLIKGGYSLEKIAKETWDAIVPMLPFIIGEIVITKVIAKLIPGAGWVMAVIDAIKTAIGALSEILRAIGAVIEWLKSVRRGGAGVLFAKAVAAGIVALLELAYEALLSGIGKYVSKVGRRLKGVAQNLGKDKGGNGDKGKDGSGGDEDKGGDKGKKPGQDGKAGDKPKDEKPTTKDGKGDRPGGDKPKDKDAPAKPSPSNVPPGKRPPSKPDPKKPTPPKDKDPKADAPSKPGQDKKPGPDKKDDDKPDTRPTPAPKPKPEPKPKPKPDPDAKPKGPNDKTPDKSKDDKDAPDKPKDADGKAADKDRPKDQDPTKPKDPNKPKGDGKDTPTKPKDKDGKDAPGTRKPKDGDGKKPKPDKDAPGRPKGRPDGKGPGKPKPKPEKAGPGRPRSKPEKEKRKKDEDSKESKDARLRKIIARIRPVLRKLLKMGVQHSSLKSTLPPIRMWYRLTRLAISSGDHFNIEAALNPEDTVIAGVRIDSDEILRIVREIAEEVQGSPEVYRQQRRIKRGSDGSIDVGRTPQTRGLAAHLRANPLQGGEYARVQAGGVNKTSLKQDASSPRNQFVEQPGVDENQKFSHDYAEMFSNGDLGTTLDQPLLAQSIIDDMSGQSSGRQAPVHQRTFQHTLGAVEENRSRSDVVYRSLAFSLGARSGSQVTDAQRQAGLGTLGEALEQLPLSLPSNIKQPNGKTKRQKEGAQSIARQLDFRLAFEDRVSMGSSRESVARDMVDMTMQEGLTDKEVKKLTGTKSTMRTYLKREHGITPEEYSRISKQKSAKKDDGTPDAAAREEARQKMREWRKIYAQHAWSEAAQQGKVNDTAGGQKMAAREIDYLQRWAKSLELDFADEADAKQKLVDKIREEVYRVNGIKSK
ncbi:DUF4157 domain-containing protein [Streptomyces sp. LHD-70]|uniref:eCIS core domain-containing protein n=1 Tax=Streptomyces sp. LHD-70 TaxID=3072140 RepID=UPI00280D3517|nr:DUF4157 domain-containing protein [Streptomyces sp. LHD-70]MDQ8702669.1 DUF4157 domain-containing protein [Streptomyces sp. LHD-70]